MAIASLRSILALKPPFTHSSAAPLPANSPRRMSDLPKIAAVIAPIPIMTGVVMKSLDIHPVAARERVDTNSHGYHMIYDKISQGIEKLLKPIAQTCPAKNSIVAIFKRRLME